MDPSYIVAACRTPIGKFLGGLSGQSAPQLGGLAVREAVRRAGLEAEDVDEVILGNVLSAGLGQAPARQAALDAGIPAAASALTVNMVCGSGLRAVMLADQAVRLGAAQVVVAGGMESMSNAPFALQGVRGQKLAVEPKTVDCLMHDGLCCAVEKAPMGVLADRTAVQRGIERRSQDAFAAESHRRALEARTSGRLDDERFDVECNGKTVEHDEGPRPGTSSESLGRLPPAFGAEGTATAGNASQISDGAAAVVVCNEERAETLKTPWKARIVSSAISGGPPADLFLAPIAAIRKLLRQSGLRAIDIDLFEINEAFASQTLACILELGLPTDRVNVHGGAIAMGHPIGASGARILTSLLHALHAKKAYRGLATLCLGGGNAVAMIVEMTD